MERTLVTMETELKLAKEQFEPLKKKINDLEKEIVRYKLDNGLYHPMSELMNYRGKDLNSIVMVERKEDGTLSTHSMCIEYTMTTDDFLEIDEGGHLYYSSDDYDIEYDNEVERYVGRFYGCSIYRDYIGFLEISVRDE